jgi:hypothetical protein
MNNTDTLSLILLELDIKDLKTLVINKNFNEILNNEYFWCQWLKKYDIHVLQDCKYIAAHINFNVPYQSNFYNAVRNEYIPVIKYYLDNIYKYQDLDIDQFYYHVLIYHKYDILKLLISYKKPDIDIYLYALAYKHYKSLKILLVYGFCAINFSQHELFTEEYKTKIITLINEHKKYKYLSYESIAIEEEIDDLFKPYITYNDFAEWRGDYLY